MIDCTARRQKPEMAMLFRRRRRMQARTRGNTCRRGAGCLPGRSLPHQTFARCDRELCLFHVRSFFPEDGGVFLSVMSVCCISCTQGCGLSSLLDGHHRAYGQFCLLNAQDETVFVMKHPIVVSKRCTLPPSIKIILSCSYRYHISYEISSLKKFKGS